MTYIRVVPDLARADIPCLCAELADRLRGGSVEGIVVCDVRAVVRPEVVTVEALARLRLTARRHGCTLVIEGADPHLTRLIDLLGLSGPLASSGPSDEAGGQAEQREEAGGVQEVVDARDPPA